MALFGKRSNLDDLMLQHLAAAERFAVRLTGRPEVAGEIVQEAFVRAAGSWRSFKGEAQFKSWFFRIMINVFCDRERKAGAVAEVGDDVPSGVDAPHERLERVELGQVIARAVSGLPARQREVAALVLYEELSMAEVGKLLGVSEQNVRTTLHYARKKLADAILPYVNVEAVHDS